MEEPLEIYAMSLIDNLNKLMQEVFNPKDELRKLIDSVSSLELILLSKLPLTPKISPTKISTI